MASNILIALGSDEKDWYKKFAGTLDKKISEGYPCQYCFVNMDASNWFDQVKDADLIIWKPTAMGARSAGYIKEKIYFLQYVANKLVVPNYESIWHFESKIAQSYFFKYHNMKNPDTTATLNYHEALQLLDSAQMPLVFKSSAGASSSNVALVTSEEKARDLIKTTFYQEVWMEEKKRNSSKWVIRFKNIRKPWLWKMILSKLPQSLRPLRESLRNIYWQEFVPGNERDLRITIIGDSYAYGFWRNNRPGDFRASGSGNIDYQSAIPEEQLRYCLQLNRDLCFDSMCYDIIFKGDEYFVTEISYGYNDSALYDVPGYYILGEDNTLKFKEGHTWPQKLWVEWALKRVERRREI